MKKNILFFILFSTSFLVAQNKGLTPQKLPEILLWNTKVPDGPGPGGENKISSTGSVTHVTTPLLLVNRPEKPNGIAILVISGGGYSQIELGKESSPASQWLQSIGITAFELIYRLPGENWKNRQVPFQDVQRALRIIRNSAGSYSINPEKIGVLGFSAGGHLAGYISSKYNTPFYAAQNSIDSVSAQPNFCALIYPVVSMMPLNSQTNSFKNLLGSNPTQEQETLFSVEKQINPQTPPTFIAQAVDDPVSPVENSILLFNSLKKEKIFVEMHLFQSGGHGWGMGKPNSDTSEWPNLFLQWLKQNQIWQNSNF